MRGRLLRIFQSGGCSLERIAGWPCPAPFLAASLAHFFHHQQLFRHVLSIQRCLLHCEARNAADRCSCAIDMREHFVIDPLISKRQQLLLATQLCRMVLKVRDFRTQCRTTCFVFFPFQYSCPRAFVFNTSLSAICLHVVASSEHLDMHPVSCAAFLAHTSLYYRFNMHLRLPP
jgi:hypothetical protein